MIRAATRNRWMTLFGLLCALGGELCALGGEGCDRRPAVAATPATIPFASIVPTARAAPVALEETESEPDAAAIRSCDVASADAKSVRTKDHSIWIYVQTDSTHKTDGPAPFTPHQDLCIVREGAPPRILVTGLSEDKADAPQHVLQAFDDLRISRDESTLYFTSEAWAVSRAVHAVDLTTGAERFLTDGSIDEIPSGPFRDLLLVRRESLDTKHPLDSPKYRGRITTWLIIDTNGKRIRALPEEEARRNRILLGGRSEGDLPPLTSSE